MLFCAQFKQLGTEQVKHIPFVPGVEAYGAAHVAHVEVPCIQELQGKEQYEQEFVTLLKENPGRQAAQTLFDEHIRHPLKPEQLTQAFPEALTVSPEVHKEQILFDEHYKQLLIEHETHKFP